jgi:HlyD family secretion protein
MIYKAVVISLFVVVALAGSLGMPRQDGPPPTATPSLEPVPSTESTTTKELDVKAQLVPVQWIELAFTNGGQLTDIWVKEGDTVQAGDRLARAGDQQKYEARIAAAEIERLSAQQALEDLHRNAAYDLAAAEKQLADARKAQDSAAWKVKKLKEPVSQIRIDQAYANMLLSEKKVQDLQKDLAKAERLLNRKRTSIFWRFVNRHTIHLMVVNLQGQLALAERRHNDAVKKYNDLIDAPDEIDLAQAEADLARADARVQATLLDRNRLINGPDPDTVALATARLRAAESALAAAQADMATSQLNAPISGTVVAVYGKVGEWAQAAQPVLVLADLTRWELETTDLAETQVSSLQPGQPVGVTFEALPDLMLQGEVLSISPLYVEQHGDVNYTARISLGQNDPRLRWGMTGHIRLANR